MAQKIKTLERQGDDIRKMEKASQKQEKVLDCLNSSNRRGQKHM